jgi:hypothetical protein
MEKGFEKQRERGHHAAVFEEKKKKMKRAGEWQSEKKK